MGVISLCQIQVWIHGLAASVLEYRSRMGLKPEPKLRSHLRYGFDNKTKTITNNFFHRLLNQALRPLMKFLQVEWSRHQSFLQQSTGMSALHGRPTSKPFLDLNYYNSCYEQFLKLFGLPHLTG